MLIDHAPGQQRDLLTLHPCATLTLVSPMVAQAFRRPEIRGRPLRSHDAQVADVRWLCQRIGHQVLWQLAGEQTWWNGRRAQRPLMHRPGLLADPLGHSTELLRLMNAHWARLHDEALRLRRVTEKLEQAARDNQRPPADLWRDVSRWLDRRPTSVERLSEFIIDGRRCWGIQCSIHDRVGLELLELAQLRPRLAECRRCGRVFVPLRREKHCRGHVRELLPDGRGSQLLRYCDPMLAPRPSSGRGDHERERDRLYKRVRRLRDLIAAERDPNLRQGLERRLERAESAHAEVLLKRGRKPSLLPNIVITAGPQATPIIGD